MATLRDAVAVLDRSPGRLEAAAAGVDLGVALRATGERDAAQAELRAGLDQADRLGGAALARRARAELVAAGARPRRHRLTGRAALTPSEMRVARLAADDRTNSEIAQLSSCP